MLVMAGTGSTVSAAETGAGARVLIRREPEAGLGRQRDLSRAG